MGGIYRGGARVCDGGCNTTVGVRLRECTHRVDGIPYCKPFALCPACLDLAGGLAKLHAGCAGPARDAQAAADARRARIEAGELFVAWAVGGPDRRQGVDIPAGMVLAAFRGRGGPDLLRLIPAGVYDYTARPALSDYPDAVIPALPV